MDWNLMGLRRRPTPTSTSETTGSVIPKDRRTPTRGARRASPGGAAPSTTFQRLEGLLEGGLASPSSAGCRSRSANRPKSLWYCGHLPEPALPVCRRIEGTARASDTSGLIGRFMHCSRHHPRCAWSHKVPRMRVLVTVMRVLRCTATPDNTGPIASGECDYPLCGVYDATQRVAKGSSKRALEGAEAC